MTRSDPTGDGSPSPVVVDPRDERRHDAGSEPLWNESWYFDWAATDGSVGGYVRLGLYPNLGVAWYWACVVGEGRPLVTVLDHEVPIPQSGLEVRSEGLWAAHNLETALDHWSLGCEAFAVGVDDPTEVYGRELRGERVPFGIDLEWETDGLLYPYPGVDRYEVPCRVSGEVLVGAERIEVDGVGQRDHSWGVRDWWAYGWCWSSAALDDGTRVHATHVAVGGDQLYATGYLQSASGGLVAVDRVRCDQDLGPDGLPNRAWIGLDPDVAEDGRSQAAVTLAIDPVAFSPVLLTAPDGRRSRFPRALCRVSVDDGRAGIGWTEWNQPESPRR